MILAVMSDLFFAVKISDAAKKAGAVTELAKDRDRAMEKAALQPALIILDLNCAEVKPLELIHSLKASSPTREVPVVAFVSHVQTALRQQAETAGCDTVLARSAFAQNLPEILAQYVNA